MKHLPYTLVFLLSPLTLGAQYEQALNTTYIQREKVLEPFYFDPWCNDSSLLFPEMEKIKKLASKHQDRELYLDAALIEAFYYCHVPQDFPRFLQELDQLMEEAKRLHYYILMARMEGLYGAYYWDVEKNYEMGFEHYLKDYEYCKKVNDTEFPDKPGEIRRVADAYYYCRDYKTAVFYFKESIRVNVSGNYVYTKHSKNSLGLCYQALHQLDSSDYYFRSNLADAARENDEPWIGITSGNLGHNYFLREKYEEAIPLLEKDVELSIQRKDWGCASGSMTILADISLRKNELEKAEEQLSAAHLYIQRSGQLDRLSRLYPLYCKFYIARGYADMALAYLDSSFAFRDSMDRRYNVLQLVRTRQRADMEKHKIEMLNVENQKKINILQRNGLIIIIGLLLVIAVFIYLHQRRKYMYRQLRLDLQLKKTGEDLAMAVQQLEIFTKSISEKNRIIETLQQQTIHPPGDDTLEKLRKNVILTEDQWTYFRDLFEKVHTGYFTRLQTRLPGLSPAETRFMALAKLGLRNKEMATALGVSDQAIRTTWYRIRKKFNLEEELQLTELVNQV